MDNGHDILSQFLFHCFAVLFRRDNDDFGFVVSTDSFEIIKAKAGQRVFIVYKNPIDVSFQNLNIKAFSPFRLSFSPEAVFE